MGNSGSTSHGKVFSRHKEASGGRGGGRWRGGNFCMLDDAPTHSSRRHLTQWKVKSELHQRPASALLPPQRADRHRSQLLCSPVVQHARSTMTGRKLDDSAVVDDNLLMGSESATSIDSLADGAHAEVELSEVTLDSNSFCPLIGPRNVTTQLEQTSEVTKSGACDAGNDVNRCEDELLQRETSSVAEMMRQQSIEGRLTHSIAIVEEWLAAQKGNVAAA